MKEWFKKQLGWVGFVVWVAFTLIAVLDWFILKIQISDELPLIGFLIMATSQTIHGIFNGEYFAKYSDKVKNGIIVFIITVTIGAIYLLIKT
jgi:hypothetical protein